MRCSYVTEAVKASTPSTHGEGAGRIWKHSLDRPVDSPCVVWGGGVADGPELGSFDELRPDEHCTTTNVLVSYAPKLLQN